MTLQDLSRRLGGDKEIEIANASCSRSDVLDKICNYIKKQGVDVDDAYLNFVDALDYSTVPVNVKYIPVYQLTTVAKITWKEKDADGNPQDHVEYIRYNSVLLQTKAANYDRVSQLDLLKALDKQCMNLNEKKVDVNIPLPKTTALLTTAEAIPQIVLDAPVETGEFYPIDIDYLCSQSDLEAKANEDLKKTKSYKNLASTDEKWTAIDHIETKVLLVPLAVITISSKEEYVNCANGKMDIIYEKSQKISAELKRCQFMAFPAIILFGIMAVATLVLFLIFKNEPTIFFEGTKVWLPFRSFNGYLWVIFIIIGIVLSFLAFPTRKEIVTKKNKNKNPLALCKRLSCLLYGMDFGFLVFLLMIIQNQLAK